MGANSFPLKDGSILEGLCHSEKGTESNKVVSLRKKKSGNKHEDVYSHRKCRSR